MKPRAARKIILLLILALIVILLVYTLLLKPLNLPLVNVLFYLVVAAFFVAYNVILHKYYRCTKCGHTLVLGNKVFLSNKCPYCKEKLE